MRRGYWVCLPWKGGLNKNDTVLEEILVVDDDAWMRQVMRDALEESGFGVVEATGGEAAPGAVPDPASGSGPPRIHLPGMDGFATCRALRQLPGGEHRRP